MAWNTHHVVVFRGSSVNDPEDTGATDYVECSVAMTTLDAWPDLIGDDVADGGGNLSSNYGARERIEFETMPFSKRTDATGELMDGGRIRKLLLEVFTRPYYWIWRVYQAGSDTDTPLERANYDASNLASSTSTDSYWNLSSVDYQQGGEAYPYSPAGQLPMRIIAPNDLRPEHLGGGVHQLRGSLYKASEESV